MNCEGNKSSCCRRMESIVDLRPACLTLPVRSRLPVNRMFPNAEFIHVQLWRTILVVLRIAAVMTTVLLIATGCCCHAADGVGGQTASPVLKSGGFGSDWSGFGCGLSGNPFTASDNPFVESQLQPVVLPDGSWPETRTAEQVSGAAAMAGAVVGAVAEAVGEDGLPTAQADLPASDQSAQISQVSFETSPAAEIIGRRGNVTLLPGQVPAQVEVPGKLELSPLGAPSVEPSAAPIIVSESQLTHEIIADRRASVEEQTDLAEELKQQLLRSFQRAADNLTQKAEVEKKIAERKAEMESGPALIAEYREQLTQPPPKSEPEYPETASVAELDQLQLLDDDKAAEARQNLVAWEETAKLRAEQKTQLPSLMETVRGKIKDAEAAAAAMAGDSSVSGIAHRTEQEAQLLLLRAQLELHRVEQLRYEALKELFPLQRDLLTRAKVSAEKRGELWKTVLADARRAESARQAEEARIKLQNAHPTLHDLAAFNSVLTQRRNEMQEYLRTRETELSGVSAMLKNLDQKFSSVTEKEHRAGLTTAVGMLLRSQRNHLPNPDEYRRKQHQAEQEIVRLQTEQMQLEDERGGPGDIQTQVDAALSVAESGATAADELKSMTVELLSDRRRYLDDLLADYDACLQTLGETDVACRRLVAKIRDFQGYIDERVLWIRSAPPVGATAMGRIWTGTHALVSHRQWQPLGEFLLRDAGIAWPVYVLQSVFFAIILGLNRTGRRFVARLGQTARKQPDSGIPSMLLAAGTTIVMASAWPSLLWFAGWRILQAELTLATALGDALRFCGGALWLVDSFRTLCRKHGVTESFLDWPQSIVRSLHRNLLFYIAGGIPLIGMFVTAGKLDEGSPTDSVGRLAFVSFCLLLSLTLRWIVRPTGPVIGDLLRSRPGSLMFRLRHLWYPLAVGSPLCLAVLAVMGYQYTAEQLMIRLQLTLGLSIVMLLAYTTVMQWMLAAKRNLALKQARARRAAAAAALQREAEAGGVPVSAVLPAEPLQVDLSLLNQQMLRLVRGMACILFLTISWGIWGQVLPALQVFSRMELWQVEVVSKESTDAAATTGAVREITRLEPVTLGDLLFSVVVISAALLASHNLPGLLELVILQRLPIDHGGRYAVTTLSRYVFLAGGMIVAANVMGIAWGNVQWLVAALTVGLGFGLQEIFANFVSGLIILFERPVRIGDVVTIDSVTGCVSRIQIRATTITDWDRREFIVPNKEFVTGRLLNWTLSDSTNRVVVNVGVAYGTDTEAALEMLQKIADEHPLVMKDPPAIVTFEGFGDSCLNLVLRCYLPNLDHRLNVISQLHVTIERRFRDAGIEIAFPQRDLHIRSLPPQFRAAASVTAAAAGQGAAMADDQQEIRMAVKRPA